MRFHTKKRRHPAINVVPLIDILAILLIFFIVTTTFRKPQPRLEINLPDSKTAEAAPAKSREPLVLAVKDAGSITLDDKPVALENLNDAIRSALESSPGRPVALQADRDAAFGIVVRVLDALKQAGVNDVPAFTQPEKQDQP